MDEQQIDVLQTKTLQAVLIGVGDEVDTVPLLVELGGDEDVLARNCRGAQAPSDAPFVAVVFGGVD